jgi:microcystin-dependent protein
MEDMGGVGGSGRITAASTSGANSVFLGGTGGAQAVSLSVGQLPAHSHTEEGVAYSGSSGNGFGVGPSGSGYPGTNVTQNTGSTGSGNAHTNTQPWIAGAWIIKF